ncbi:MAG TPA: ubiquinone/menaquinone biosynthesis methyltransferase [Kiritimatiellia bacterium]|nr:ubiquinone/menaquinone biosynthesis methyltransferase [Kiritimatiellia bacterium]
MSAIFHLRAREHLDTPDRKRRFNALLFREVAPRYDLITSLLSFGRDAAWKREMIAALPARASAPAQCLDIACGTGDLTRAVARRYSGARVTGLDLTPEMLERARALTAEPRVDFVQGDMHALPLPDASVDLVTGGYALRNAPDLAVALREIGRVLKPGGTCAFLDFSKSPNPLAQRVGYLLLKAWGGFWGLLLHGHADVYGYIADSLRVYPDCDALREQLDRAGLLTVDYRVYMGGLVEWIICRKTAG